MSALDLIDTISKAERLPQAERESRSWRLAAGIALMGYGPLLGALYLATIGA